MYCKFCGAELGDNEVICMSCGSNNSDQPPKKSLWKPILAGLCAVLVIAGLAAGVMMWVNQVPSDQVTCKESYTGTSQQVLDALDTVVAKAGNVELTNGELQIAYWTMVYDFISYYQDYVQYFFDLSTPLGEQMYDETITWEQHFLTLTVDTWHRYQVLSGEATANGMAMSPELESHLDGLYESMEAALEDLGMESVEEMVTHDFGVGGTYDNYILYMRSYYHGNEYYNHLLETLEITDAEVESYYTAKETDFVDSGYGKEDGKIVSVRHILLQPNDDPEAESYTEVEWAACQTEAELLLQQWLDGGATEELFDSMARQYSSCGSAANGGLISDITEGQMVESFENWIMADGRKYGDYGLVKSEFGWHIMFFVEGDALWHMVAEANVASQKVNEYIAEKEGNYPLTVDYSKVWLGAVSMG